MGNSREISIRVRSCMESLNRLSVVSWVDLFRVGMINNIKPEALRRIGGWKKPSVNEIMDAYEVVGKELARDYVSEVEMCEV